MPNDYKIVCPYVQSIKYKPIKVSERSLEENYSRKGSKLSQFNPLLDIC